MVKVVLMQNGSDRQTVLFPSLTSISVLQVYLSVKLSAFKILYMVPLHCRAGADPDCSESS